MAEWYREYLESPHWQALRQLKLESEEYCCERCGYFGRRRRGGVWAGIHVHHKTYERVGHELMADLEVLCEFCHGVEHGKNTRTREQLRAKYVAGVLEYAEEVDGL